MADSTPVQCPECGWTGYQSDLERTAGTAACPNCAQSIGGVE